MFVECSFCIQMIANFLTDFTVEGENYPTRDFNKIAKNYIKNDFLVDFIALLPFQLIHMENHE